MACSVDKPCSGPLRVLEDVRRSTGRTILCCRNGHSFAVDPPPTLSPGQARGIVNGHGITVSPADPSITIRTRRSGGLRGLTIQHLEDDE